MNSQLLPNLATVILFPIVRQSEFLVGAIAKLALAAMPGKLFRASDNAHVRLIFSLKTIGTLTHSNTMAMYGHIIKVPLVGGGIDIEPIMTKQISGTEGKLFCTRASANSKRNK